MFRINRDMNGWLYLIKNGDLHKIGITKNFKNRMKQLKPDKVIAKIYTSNFKLLEREFHKKYKSVRIPQTEYFRLDHFQVREIKYMLRKISYPLSITLWIFFQAFLILLLIFFGFFIFLSLNSNDVKNVLFNSLYLIEKISICLSFISITIRSDFYFSIINELKFRVTRGSSFILYALFFRYLYRFLL